jgi:hypothetical protein
MVTVVETRDGQCPLQWNYAQERFLMACYNFEGQNRPAYGFWDAPAWVRQGVSILTNTVADEQEAARQK